MNSHMPFNSSFIIVQYSLFISECRRLPYFFFSEYTVAVFLLPSECSPALPLHYCISLLFFLNRAVCPLPSECSPALPLHSCISLIISTLNIAVCPLPSECSPALHLYATVSVLFVEFFFYSEYSSLSASLRM